MESDEVVSGTLREASTQGHPGETDPTKEQRASLTTPPGAGWFIWVLLSIVFLAMVGGIWDTYHLRSSHQTPKPTTLWLDNSPKWTVIPRVAPSEPTIKIANPERNMQYHYAMYNVRYFDGKLTGAIIKCETDVGNATGTLASTWWSGDATLILVRTELCYLDPKVYLPMLIHEMVHQKMGNVKVHNVHSPEYREEMKRVIRAGALDTIMNGDE